MVELSLANLVERGLARTVIGDAAVRVSGIRHDSRAVEPGDLFAAIAGVRHGTEFAPDAIARGASAVLCDHPFSCEVPVLVCDDTLVALAAIARELYGDPTARLAVVGVTGTNGKTTTAYLVEAVVAAAGRVPAVLGTVSFRAGGQVRAATHTTPMADDLMRLAGWSLEQGASHLVLEVSSHGLHMHRVDGVRFAVAAFTNLTRDHLDYHGDFASYGRAKRRLFEALAPAASVINVDDPFGAEIAADLRGQRVLRCSRHAQGDAEIRALQWRSDAQGIAALIATPQGELALHSPLVGEHMLENLLVALGCGLALGFPLEQVGRGLASSLGAPGRLERVADPEVGAFVDYAHTPDALERVLRALRPVCTGRLFAVFGCGGDRDRGKRPLMGKLAAELADIALVTSDNPRSEPPESILAEIEVGVKQASSPKLAAEALASASRGYVVQGDRRAAIELAVAAARAGDVVLVAGKGHEKTQIIGKRHEPFDDCAELQAALARRSARARGEGG